MPLAIRRVALPLLAFALTAACGSLDLPAPVNIPDGAAIYRIEPTLVSDEYIDTTAGRNVGLTWLSGQGFDGYNCFGFSPTTPTDTTGSFVFGWAGPNTGTLERRTSGVIDTTVGYFISSQAPGTHGTYVVGSSGTLTLNWADGVRNRYFAPSAVIRLVGDTVESRADLRARGDSVRDQWHVYWIASPTCP